MKKHREKKQIKSHSLEKKPCNVTVSWTIDTICFICVFCLNICVFFFKFVLVCMFSHFLWKFSLFHVTFLFLLETVHYPKTERKIMSMSNICTFMPRLSYLLRDFFSSFIWCIQLIRCCVNIYLYQIINLLKNLKIFLSFMKLL